MLGNMAGLHGEGGRGDSGQQLAGGRQAWVCLHWLLGQLIALGGDSAQTWPTRTAEGSRIMLITCLEINVEEVSVICVIFLLRGVDSSTELH